MKRLLALLAVGIVLGCNVSGVFGPQLKVGGVWDFTFTGTWIDCTTFPLNGPVEPILDMQLEQDGFRVRGETTVAGRRVTFSGQIEERMLRGGFQTCLNETCPVGGPCLNQSVTMTKASRSRLTGSHNSHGINCVTCTSRGTLMATIENHIIL